MLNASACLLFTLFFVLVLFAGFFVTWYLFGTSPAVHVGAVLSGIWVAVSASAYRGSGRSRWRDSRITAQFAIGLLMGILVFASIEYFGLGLAQFVRTLQ